MQKPNEVIEIWIIYGEARQIISNQISISLSLAGFDYWDPFKSKFLMRTTFWARREKTRTYTGLGKRVVPMLRESRLLTPSGCGARVHTT